MSFPIQSDSSQSSISQGNSSGTDRSITDSSTGGHGSLSDSQTSQVGECWPLLPPDVSEVDTNSFVVTAPKNLFADIYLQLQVKIDGESDWNNVDEPVGASGIIILLDRDPSDSYWVRWVQVGAPSCPTGPEFLVRLDCHCGDCPPGPAKLVYTLCESGQSPSAPINAPRGPGPALKFTLDQE